MDGEFALALVDRKQGMVLLAVDAFGTKNLWYYRGLSNYLYYFGGAPYYNYSIIWAPIPYSDY